MTQAPLTSEQVSQYLIGNGLYLTGLEFLVEGQELGGFDLQYLQNFFANTSRFPSDELQKFQGEDALSNLLLAKEREQKLCLAEYELRVATEDLKQTKDQIQQKILDENGSMNVSEDSSLSNRGDMENANSTIRKHLNMVVIAYLMQSGYKVTAMTFQEEANPEFSEQSVPEDTLLQYYKHSLDSSIKESFSHTLSGEECMIFSDHDFIVNQNDVDSVSCSKHESVTTAQDQSPTTNSQATCKELDSSRSIFPSTPPIDLIHVLTDTLPKIVPNILINKRSECIPTICSLIFNHPDPSFRSPLVQLLFNLIKKPDEDQRQIIIHGIETLASSIGSERTSQEIIPHCCEHVEHKSADRRLLIAEVIGSIAQYVDKDIGSSLLFSLLRQLSEDPEASVREASLLSLASLLQAIPVPLQKQTMFEDLILKYVMDVHDAVSEQALQRFVPLLAENKENRIAIKMSFLLKILRTALCLLEEDRMEHGSQRDNSQRNGRLVIPRNSQQKKILTLIQFYIQLQPIASKLFLHALCLETLNRHKGVDQHSFAENASTGEEWKELSVGSSIEEWFLTTKTSLLSEEIDCFLYQAIPTLLTIIQQVSPSGECLKLRGKLTAAIKSSCQSLGNPLTKAFLKPLMISLSGIGEWIHQDCSWLENIRTRMNPFLQEDTEDHYCILPVLLAAITASEGENKMHKFLKALFRKGTAGSDPWAIVHSKDFLDTIIFCGSMNYVYKLLLQCFASFCEEQESSFRIGALLLAEALSLHAPISDISSFIAPVVLKVSIDKSNETTQIQALSSIQKMAIVFASEAELLKSIHQTIEIVIRISSFQVRLAALDMISFAASRSNIHVPFVLRQLPTFLNQFHNPELTTGHELHNLALTIFNSLRILEGVEILTGELHGHLVSSMERLSSDGAPFLDNAHRQILSSMLSDESSKLGKIVINRSSKGSSLKSVTSPHHRRNFSSDASYTSETPAL